MKTSGYDLKPGHVISRIGRNKGPFTVTSATHRTSAPIVYLKYTVKGRPGVYDAEIVADNLYDVK